ncbi:MAG TPA: hypothetical protein VFQ76_01665 [Longimicrobiaceae bacterium]|nr:hypothetical protein [Longimicrobiaceae bacterium]
MMMDRNHFGRGLRPLPRLALAAALALPLTACDTDGLLDVEDPDVTRPEALFDPSNLPALRATVIGDFSVAYGGSSSTTANIGLTHVTGLMSDEFWHSGTYGQNREIDKRQIGATNSFMSSLTRNLYRAINTSRVGIESYQQNDPNSSAQAELVNLQAYLYTFFGENFCPAVPFSQDVNGEFEYGSPENNEQVLTRALGAFDQALTVANAARAAATTTAARTVADRQINLARVGRARVLLGLNRYADAATAVRDVPSSFSYVVEFSANTGRQNNGLWGNNFGRREIAMADREGLNGVNFRVGTATAANTVVSTDPRTPWSFVNGAADTRSIHYFAQKYPAQATGIVLASGTEARLIEAEVALNRGSSNAYLATLNTLRSGIGLAALTDPGTPAARVRQFFDERARWMFGTGQRLGELRRIVRQYNPAIPGEFTVAKVFPTGTYFRPGTTGQREDGVYGNQVNLLMVFDEGNNPNYNADQCVPTAV